jgi:flagellar biosynthetic protein FliR
MSFRLVVSWWVPQAATVALVLGRVSGLAWTAPGWGTIGLSWRIRAGLVLLLSLLLVPLVGPEVRTPREPIALARGCLGEVAVGAALGLTAALAVAGARQAGEIVGAQAGLSAAALYDPDAGEELTPIGHLYGLIALATFLALDGPLKLVGALAESFRAVPAGGFTLTETEVSAVFGRVGWALGLALGAAAPAAVALITAGLSLGLLARATPTLQFASLAIPIRTIVGVLVVLVGLVSLVARFASAWSLILDGHVP